MATKRKEPKRQSIPVLGGKGGAVKERQQIGRLDPAGDDRWSAVVLRSVYLGERVPTEGKNIGVFESETQARAAILKAYKRICTAERKYRNRRCRGNGSDKRPENRLPEEAVAVTINLANYDEIVDRLFELRYETKSYDPKEIAPHLATIITEAVLKDVLPRTRNILPDAEESIVPEADRLRGSWLKGVNPLEAASAAIAKQGSPGTRESVRDYHLRLASAALEAVRSSSKS